MLNFIISYNMNEGSKYYFTLKHYYVIMCFNSKYSHEPL